MLFDLNPISWKSDVYGPTLGAELTEQMPIVLYLKVVVLNDKVNKKNMLIADAIS